MNENFHTCTRSFICLIKSLILKNSNIFSDMEVITQHKIWKFKVQDQHIALSCFRYLCLPPIQSISLLSNSMLTFHLLSVFWVVGSSTVLLHALLPSYSLHPKGPPKHKYFNVTMVTTPSDLRISWCSWLYIIPNCYLIMQTVSQHTDYGEIYLLHAQSIQAPVFTIWTSFFLKKWNAIYPLKKN